MQRLLLRLGVNALALYLTIGTGWLAGVTAEDTSATGFLILALIFGIVNALIRPILKVLTCPFILLTLGLFTVAINAFLLWLTAEIGVNFGVGVMFENIWWLVGASLVISVVSAVLTMLLREELG